MVAYDSNAEEKRHSARNNNATRHFHFLALVLLIISAAVHGQSAPTPTNFTLESSSSTSIAGQQFQISWSVANAANCVGTAYVNESSVTLSGWTNVASATSPRSVTASAAGVYTLNLSCSNSAGIATSQPLNVTVSPAVNPTITLEDSNGRAFDSSHPIFRGQDIVLRINNPTVDSCRVTTQSPSGKDKKVFDKDGPASATTANEQTTEFESPVEVGGTTPFTGQINNCNLEFSSCGTLSVTATCGSTTSSTVQAPVILTESSTAYVGDAMYLVHPNRPSQVAIVPFYYARNGLTTKVRITNVGDVTGVWAVNLQESENGRPVVDTNELNQGSDSTFASNTFIYLAASESVTLEVTGNIDDSGGTLNISSQSGPGVCTTFQRSSGSNLTSAAFTGHAPAPYNIPDPGTQAFSRALSGFVTIIDTGDLPDDRSLTRQILLGDCPDRGLLVTNTLSQIAPPTSLIEVETRVLSPELGAAPIPTVGINNFTQRPQFFGDNLEPTLQNANTGSLSIGVLAMLRDASRVAFDYGGSGVSALLMPQRVDNSITTPIVPFSDGRVGAAAIVTYPTKRLYTDGSYTTSVVPPFSELFSPHGSCVPNHTTITVVPPALTGFQGPSDGTCFAVNLLGLKAQQDTTVPLDFPGVAASPPDLSERFAQFDYGLHFDSADSLTFTFDVTPPVGQLFSNSGISGEGVVTLTGQPAITTELAFSPVATVLAELTPDVQFAVPLSTIQYSLAVTNTSLTAGASGTLINATLPSGASSYRWQCSASRGALCPSPTGAGGLNEVVDTLPAGGHLDYSITVILNTAPPDPFVTTVAIEPGSDANCEPSSCVVSSSLSRQPATVLIPADSIHSADYGDQHGMQFDAVNTSNSDANEVEIALDPSANIANFAIYLGPTPCTTTFNGQQVSVLCGAQPPALGVHCTAIICTVDRLASGERRTFFVSFASGATGATATVTVSSSNAVTDTRFIPAP